MEQATFTETELRKVWEYIGNNNDWIKEAYDPAFNQDMFHKCNTLEELQAQFVHGNWSVGQAFYFKNLCFINQKDGGDEWLAIKDDYDFESVTFENIIKRGIFFLYIEDMLTATKEECIQLNYKRKSKR